MEQTLLNEIVARVAAKLAEAEGGEAASAAASRDDREGLLLLSQEMNDTCRAMLKCEKLKARFRVDCASLQSEPAELDSYGVVVLTGLTNEALAKLALGLCDTPYTRLAAQAILAGKRVYIHRGGGALPLRLHRPGGLLRHDEGAPGSAPDLRRGGLLQTQPGGTPAGRRGL